MNILARCTCFVGLFLVIAGCSNQNYEGAQRFAVSGKVTVDGTPVDVGTISFLPAGNEQRVAGGPIADGVFAVKEDIGPNAGPYMVEIHWHKKTGKQYMDRDAGEMYDERTEGLPARYHTSTELTAEVTAKQTTFDFDLQSE